MTLTRRVLPALLFIFAALSAHAQQFDQRLYQSMRWRMIGPFRGGRTVGATGVPGRPNVFYIGVNNGGVWKTTTTAARGRRSSTTSPPAPSARSPSRPRDPNIIYVGSGEGLQRPDLSVGDGIYKSTDGGKTWKHLGLRDGQQIGADHRRPARPRTASSSPCSATPTAPTPSAASSARPTAAETSRRCSTRTRTPAPSHSPSTRRTRSTVYAVLWAARQGPWENGAWQGPGSGLFKSTDGGTTWRPLTKGLPTFAQGLGRIGIAVAPSDPRRLFADRGRAAARRRLPLGRRGRDAGGASTTSRACGGAAATSPR